MESEECSYDGDVDNDSFKSAVCEMYGGFRHTIFTEIFASQTVKDETFCTSSGDKMKYESEHNDLVIYASDEDVIDDNSCDGLLSIDDEYDLEYVESSYLSDGNLSFDTDISFGECIDEGSIVPSFHIYSTTIFFRFTIIQIYFRLYNFC